MEKYSINSQFVQDFDAKVLELVNQGLGDFDEQVFNELALTEFEIQYNTVEYYREFCHSRGVTPETITSWAQIPAVPSGVFKQQVIAGFPLHETELTIMTSGTSNPNTPTKIYRDKRCVEMYYQANTAMTKSFLFPDVERMKILLMVPSPKVAPSMGMAVGLEQMRQNFGTEDSIYLISPEGMEWELLFNAFKEAQEQNQPVAIVGATSGLVFFFNFCLEQGLRFQLPQGSRICDGGGYLGTFGECNRDEYYRLCAEVLGVPETHCVNTLGSGESTTNYFDNSLRNAYLGQPNVPRYKVCPPWTRTIVVDPNTGERLPKGEVGLIRHYDLVNRANLMVVQTGNLGVEIEDGFEILGRADAVGKAESTVLNKMISTQPGICSTVADEILQGSTCSTVATEMLTHAQTATTCSTIATEMLVNNATASSCSTVANEMLANSPHGNRFSGLSPERLEKLKSMCPFLKIQGLWKKAK